MDAVVPTAVCVLHGVRMPKTVRTVVAHGVDGVSFLRGRSRDVRRRVDAVRVCFANRRVVFRSSCRCFSRATQRFQRATS
jgi:hypothetical protein